MKPSSPGDLSGWKPFKAFNNSSLSVLAQVRLLCLELQSWPKIPGTATQNSIVSEHLHSPYLKPVFNIFIKLSLQFLESPLPPNNVECNWNHSDVDKLSIVTTLLGGGGAGE